MVYLILQTKMISYKKYNPRYIYQEAYAYALKFSLRIDLLFRKNIESTSFKFQLHRLLIHRR